MSDDKLILQEDSNKFLNVVAALFLVGFTFFVLKELQAIFIPFFIAILVAFIVQPFYKFLLKKRVPSPIAILIIVLSILLVSNFASIFILTSINSFSQEFPKYEKKFLDFYEHMILKFELSPQDVENLNKSMDIRRLLMSGSLTSTITGVFASITNILGNYVLIIFYVIFILAESKSFMERVDRAFTKEKAITINNNLENIFSGVKSYMLGKTFLSFLQAVLIGTFLWICGVDFFIIWAFLFFLTDFIPNIGSMLATILVAITMLLQFESILFPAIVTVILIVIQNLKGNILEPKIFGARLDLSPLILLLSLVFWGYIWGIIGMILSVPIMSMIKITLMNFPQTRPYGILLSYNLTSLKPIKEKIIKPVNLIEGEKNDK